MKIQLSTSILVAAATAVPYAHARPFFGDTLTHLYDTGLLQRPSLTKRDMTSVPDGYADQCPVETDTIAGEAFLHFTGIFFEEFITGGGQDILGPLAVGDTFTAPGYIVNANEDVDCNADIHSSFNSYGLVVGGLTETTDTDVHGDAFLAGGGTVEEVHEEDPPCEVYTDEGTAHFDFGAVEEASRDINQLLAMMTPNLVMREGGELVSLGGDSPYKVMTFNTCNDRNCPVDGALSDPKGIFFNDGNYNGPHGDVPSENDTIVFNIPVTVGSTLRLTGNQPSLGFYACRTIYNFYPVNEDGQFLRYGTFTLVRETGSQLEGFSLAPRGHIRDGLTGNFAGTIIGLDYTWEYFPQGVEIHDYPAANCLNFEGCLPINPGSPNTTTTTTMTSTTTRASMTITTTETQTRSATITHTTTFTTPTTTTEHDGSTVTETDQETIYINDPWKNEWKNKKKWGDKGKDSWGKDSWEQEEGSWGKESWDQEDDSWGEDSWEQEDSWGKGSWGKKGSKWEKYDSEW